MSLEASPFCLILYSLPATSSLRHETKDLVASESYQGYRYQQLREKREVQ
jgi:hypothetical protein